MQRDADVDRSRILAIVHAGDPPIMAASVATPAWNRTPPVNNLHSNDS
jgi:hypothetical protein